MTNYQIAEISSKLVVAGRVYNQAVMISKTPMAFKILMLFLRQGIIKSIAVKSMGIEVRLKYFRRRPLLKNLQIISKPGRRVYWSLSTLSKYYNKSNFGGFYVISTPQGLFTTNECLTTIRSGGEVLYKITLN